MRVGAKEGFRGEPFIGVPRHTCRRVGAREGFRGEPFRRPPKFLHRKQKDDQRKKFLPQGGPETRKLTSFFLAGRILTLCKHRKNAIETQSVKITNNAKKLFGTFSRLPVPAVILHVEIAYRPKEQNSRGYFRRTGSDGDCCKRPRRPEVHRGCPVQSAGRGPAPECGPLAGWWRAGER